MTSTIETIGRNCGKLRSKQKITLEELGFRVDKSISTIWNIENYEKRNLSLTEVEDLAKALGVTPSYLCGWDESNPRLSYITSLLTAVNDDQLEKITEIVKVLR